MFLRGWGDYQRYSLKLTESELPGLGHIAIRAWSPEALERRVAAIEADRARASAGSRATTATGPPTGSRDPDGHRVRALLRERPLRAAAESCARRSRTCPSATSVAAPRSSGWITSTCWPQDVAANRRFAQEQLGFRLYEQIVLDDGVGVGRLDEPHDRGPRADLRRRPRRRAAAGCTTSRSSSTPARSCCAPPTCSSTPTSRSRRRRPSTRSHRGCSCTSTSRAATASRSRPAPTSSTTPRTSRSSGPRPSAPAGRPGGCRRSRPSTPTGRPTSAGRPTGPPIPPTSQVPSSDVTA